MFKTVNWTQLFISKQINHPNVVFLGSSIATFVSRNRFPHDGIQKNEKKKITTSTFTQTTSNPTLRWLCKTKWYRHTNKLSDCGIRFSWISFCRNQIWSKSRFQFLRMSSQPCQRRTTFHRRFQHKSSERKTEKGSFKDYRWRIWNHERSSWFSSRITKFWSCWGHVQ